MPASQACCNDSSSQAILNVVTAGLWQQLTDIIVIFTCIHALYSTLPKHFPDLEGLMVSLFLHIIYLLRFINKFREEACIDTLQVCVCIELIIVEFQKCRQSVKLGLVIMSVCKLLFHKEETASAYSYALNSNLLCKSVKFVKG